jgi:branched-chain amino acid transport system substrate-binding protein
MKKLLSVLLAAALVFSLTACGDKSSAGSAASGAATTGSILIGGLAPLTGDAAVYGTSAANGAKLALEEINAAGGVLGKKIEYNCLDEKGDPTEAVNAYNNLVSQNIVALLGDVTSKPTMAVAQIAAEANMPMLSPTASAEAVTTYGENVFRVCYIDPFQGKTMATYAKDKLNAKKVAIIYNTSSDYSGGLKDAFVAQAKSLGLEVTNTEGYGANDVDFKTQLTNIAKNKPDVLFIPDYYSQVALIVAQAKEVGLTSTLVGADGWDGVATTVDKNNVKGLDNSYFCSHYSVQDKSEKIQNFLTKYKAKYNEDPASFAALGYDAAYILADAIKRAGNTDKAAIVKALKDTNYEGVTGSN